MSNTGTVLPFEGQNRPRVFFVEIWAVFGYYKIDDTCEGIQGCCIRDKKQQNIDMEVYIYEG